MEEDSTVNPRESFLWLTAHGFNINFHLLVPRYMCFFSIMKKVEGTVKEPRYDISGGIENDDQI